jgi:Alkaline phosphatase PhoX
MRSITRAVLIGTVGSLLVAGASYAHSDHGSSEERERFDHSDDLYGIKRPLVASSTLDLTADQINADPASVLSVAKGLKVKVVSTGSAGANIDQMVLWPMTHPTHLIVCNEEGTTSPGVQAIKLTTGAVTTLVTGTTSCDPVRVTPWGTLLFGEEAGATGAMYEMIDPLSVVGATLDRTTGVASSTNIRRVDAYGNLSFEGLAVLPNGVSYYGDELSASNGSPGGAYYKFVPSVPWAGGAAISDLDQSPLASGTVYGLRAGQGSNYGQGFATGIGSWQQVTVTGGSLRPLATAAKLTGFYRPEDMDIDTAALGDGDARMCMNNTGRDTARYWGEAMCLTDGPLAGTTSGASVPEIQTLVVGSTQLNMPDNIAYQAGRGNWIIQEDGSTSDHPDGARNNDIWSCLDDGIDADTLSDGCVRIATLNDFDAETTGGFFDASGRHYYVSIQHNSTGTGLILDVTGWR